MLAKSFIRVFGIQAYFSPPRPLSVLTLQIFRLVNTHEQKEEEDYYFITVYNELSLDRM